MENQNKANEEQNRFIFFDEYQIIGTEVQGLLGKWFEAYSKNTGMGILETRIGLNGMLELFRAGDISDRYVYMYVRLADGFKYSRANVGIDFIRRTPTDSGDIIVNIISIRRGCYRPIINIMQKLYINSDLPKDRYQCNREVTFTIEGIPGVSSGISQFSFRCMPIEMRFGRTQITRIFQASGGQPITLLLIGTDSVTDNPAYIQVGMSCGNLVEKDPVRTLFSDPRSILFFQKELDIVATLDAILKIIFGEKNKASFLCMDMFKFTD